MEPLHRDILCLCIGIALWHYTPVHPLWIYLIALLAYLGAHCGCKTMSELASQRDLMDIPEKMALGARAGIEYYLRQSGLALDTPIAEALEKLWQNQDSPYKKQMLELVSS